MKTELSLIRIIAIMKIITIIGYIEVFLSVTRMEGKLVSTKISVCPEHKYLCQVQTWNEEENARGGGGNVLSSRGGVHHNFHARDTRQGQQFDGSLWSFK